MICKYMDSLLPSVAQNDIPMVYPNYFNEYKGQRTNRLLKNALKQRARRRQMLDLPLPAATDCALESGKLCFQQPVSFAEVLAMEGTMDDRVNRGSLPAEPIATAIEPVIGVISPPANRPLPDEAKRMYPTGVRFLVTGLGLKKMTLTPDGYDSVIAKIPDAARELRDKGAQGIALMGTSLTFYKGAEFNRQLTQFVREATGLPCVTMSTAIVEALKAVKGRRVAVATAYSEAVNGCLLRFLNESGFQVTALKGLGLEQMDGPGKITEDEVRALCADVCHLAPHADSLLISCGGLVTLGIHVELEKRYKLPVVSSTPALFWAAVRMMGHSGRAPGLGMLLES